MHHSLLLILGLLFSVFLLVILAQRIKIAYPIFLARSNLESDIDLANKRLESLECDETEHQEIEKYYHVLLNIYSIQRKELFKMRKEKLFSDEEIRKAELQLDLNKLKITGAGH